MERNDQNGQNQNSPFRAFTTSSRSNEWKWKDDKSSSSSSSKLDSIALESHLKRLIQPFVMKCHPDMARQQGLPKTGQVVNLTAIQNLNAYLDGIQKILRRNNKNNQSSNNISRSTYHYPFAMDSVVEIEFVMAAAFGKGKSSRNRNSNNSNNITTNGQPNIITSRRKVEWQVPPPHMTLAQVFKHVQGQIIKLLKIADLPVPPSSLFIIPYDDDDDDDEEQDGDNYKDSSTLRSSSTTSTTRPIPLTPWQASRQRFWNRIRWNKFDSLYQQALQDAQANVLTKHKVRNNPKLRRALLAKLMTNVQFVSSSFEEETNNEHSEELLSLPTTVIPLLDRLVVYRRLLRFFDVHFDELFLEDFGSFWEDRLTLLVVSTPAAEAAAAKPYYHDRASSPIGSVLWKRKMTSTKKRRKKDQYNIMMETGYSFTIHHTNHVTVQVPIDFTDPELLQELTRNIVDFVEWTSTTTTTTNSENRLGGIQGIYESMMMEDS